MSAGSTPDGIGVVPPDSPPIDAIGTVAGVLQPVVVNAKLRNIPEQGIYNWDPGAYFGIYKPDGFWFDLSEASAKSASAVSPPTAAPW